MLNVFMVYFEVILNKTFTAKVNLKSFLKLIENYWFELKINHFWIYIYQFIVKVYKLHLVF